MPDAKLFIFICRAQARRDVVALSETGEAEVARVRVRGEEVRRLTKVVEIVEVGRPAGSVQLNTPFVWDPATDTFYFKEDSKMFQKITRTFGVSREKLQAEFSQRTKLLLEMLKRNITGYKDVQDLIHRYAKNPVETLKTFGIATQ